MSEKCNGRGECFAQNCVGVFDKLFDCEHNCQLIKCPNFRICEKSLPQQFIDCYHGLCASCNVLFGPRRGGKGILEFKSNTECPICLEEKCDSVSFPKCSHFVCIDCFKRMWWLGEDVEPGEPQFPYSDEVWDEFEDLELEGDQSKLTQFHIKYPLVNTFFEAHNQWQDLQEEKYEAETNLRKCPLCRK